MKLSSCQSCGQLLYFENVRCENCGRALGYMADRTDMTALDLGPRDGWTVLAAHSGDYKFCKNFDAGMCNWLVHVEDETGFCAACRHNQVVPDLSVPANDVLWRKIETAKHRLFYPLLRFGLPLHNRVDDLEHGIAFNFLADSPTMRKGL